MKYEILNILQKSGDQWQYTGQIIDGAQRRSISGSVGNYPTNSQIKAAIIKKIERAILDYERSQRPIETKRLSEDNNFKPILSISP